MVKNGSDRLALKIDNIKIDQQIRFFLSPDDRYHGSSLYLYGLPLIRGLVATITLEKNEKRQGGYFCSCRKG
jgi:hypothetical protein